MRARVLVAGIVVIVAAGLLVADGVRSLRITDAEIEAGAPEDTLGFGIYPVLGLLTVPGFIALVWLWKSPGQSRSRVVPVSLAAALVLSALFAIWAYNTLRGRVLR